MESRARKKNSILFCIFAFSWNNRENGITTDSQSPVIHDIHENDGQKVHIGDSAAQA